MMRGSRNNAVVANLIKCSTRDSLYNFCTITWPLKKRIWSLGFINKTLSQWWWAESAELVDHDVRNICANVHSWLKIKPHNLIEWKSANCLIEIIIHLFRGPKKKPLIWVNVKLSKKKIAQKYRKSFWNACWV